MPFIVIKPETVETLHEDWLVALAERDWDRLEDICNRMERCIANKCKYTRGCPSPCPCTHVFGKPGVAKCPAEEIIR